MNFLIQMPDGKYVLKYDGWNLFVDDPREATAFDTKDLAVAAKPGHDRDMGGSGYKGTVRAAHSEISAYEQRSQNGFRF